MNIFLSFCFLSVFIYQKRVILTQPPCAYCLFNIDIFLEILRRARNTGDDVRTIAGPWEGRRGLEERLAAKSTTLELKVVETSEP